MLEVHLPHLPLSLLLRPAGYCSVLAVILLLLVRQYLVRKVRSPLPPGPKTSWYGGAALPKAYPWRTYAEWQRLYGDIIYIHAVGNPILVLNSRKAIYDLLETRSAIYSSRPRRTMTRELMGWDWLFSSMPYGSAWRKRRALFQKYFHPRASPRYEPVQIKEAHTLLRNLADSPDKFSHHIRRSAAAVVMMVSYGHQVAQEGDYFVTIADHALTGLALAGNFGTYLVDYIPILKYVPAWMPGAGFRRQADVWRKSTHAMVEKPFELVQQQLASGTARPSLASEELEEWTRSGQDPEQAVLIKDVAAISYAAGADTTVSAILSFFLAMSLYPDVQRRVQEQLDKVTGSQRLPLFSDRSALPIIDCVVSECLRWNPVTPLSLPHFTVEDDVYEGYWVPKGTTVLPNVWKLLHDPAMYPDPMTFNPDRFADSKTNVELGINEEPLAAFGFGRRICPGRYLAMDTIWITIVSVLSVYNISKPLDKDGVAIEPDIEPTSSFLSRPKPFQCWVTPRSKAALSLIKESEDEQP
ncbi:cytochrome P450 [Artomyces pyxidatus]|uniref:Cytochrome P450 n=1 Tax=Artomyces pyxidatus TaxID=48021 RepID=A0ACB8TIR6_9AGAM|nr:cytochrome P450 [Artomyces pyxidatus]